MEVTCAKTKTHLRHVTPRHLLVLYQPPCGDLSHRSGEEHIVHTPHDYVVRVKVRRNAERHYLRGTRSGNLMIYGERKSSRQWMQMRSGCLFCSPCCGNSSVLKLFLGGRGVSLRLCVHPRVVVRRLSNLPSVGSFFAYLWGEKNGVAVRSARGTTQIRGSVGRT